MSLPPQDSTNLRESWFAEPCFLGIDEAGRGPVLGPMVYACAFAPLAYRNTLADRAYADSKTLTEEKRDALLKAIQADTQLAYLIDAVTAADISMNMLSRSKVSLNALANDQTFRLLDGVLQQGVNLKEVFVDTVGDAERWQTRLSQKYPGIAFTVCPKADALYLIVSAASIVAKVTRDMMLRDYRPKEGGLKSDITFGSGYPGDPVTTAWLGSNMDRVFGYPELVRFSWQTTSRLLEESAVPVRWEADVDDPAQSTLSFAPAAEQPGSLGNSKADANSAVPLSRLTASNGKCRHSYFRARKLQRIVNPI